MFAYACKIEILVTLFDADCKRRNYLSAECVSTANAVDSDTGVFNRRSVSVSDWLVSDTLLHNS